MDWALFSFSICVSFPGDEVGVSGVPCDDDVNVLQISSGQSSRIVDEFDRRGLFEEVVCYGVEGFGFVGDEGEDVVCGFDPDGEGPVFCRLRFRPHFGFESEDVEFPEYCRCHPIVDMQIVDFEIETRTWNPKVDGFRHCQGSKPR